MNAVNPSWIKGVSFPSHFSSSKILSDEMILSLFFISYGVHHVPLDL